MTPFQPNPPVALTIAGSDNSAGAGIQADLKTFSHFGVYGLTAVTCVVAEVPGRVAAIQSIETRIIAEQIALSLGHFPVTALKTGMLFSAEIIHAVVQTLKTHASSIPIVVDPVMVATSGDSLLQADAVDAMRNELFPIATLITPNLDEAAALLDGQKITSVNAMELAAKTLSARFGTAVLLKGGHLAGPTAIDLLVINDHIWTYETPFIDAISTHGTGCTLSAAITAQLACGHDLPRAVRAAKDYITEAIRQSFHWNSPEETSALNHFPN